MTSPTEADAPLIDARGLKCPWPVLRAARAMREHDAIALLADDPVARTDVPALAEVHGWSLDTCDCGDHVRYRIRKAVQDSAC